MTGPTAGEPEILQASSDGFSDEADAVTETVKTDAELSDKESNSTAALTAVQTSAAVWQTSLTAILGIIGLGSILSRNDVQALTSGQRSLVIISLIVSVVAAAGALFLVTRAAAGLPKGKVFSLPSGRTQAFRTHIAQPSEDKALEAARYLRASLAATALSLAVALVGVCILWGSQDAPAATSVQLTVQTSGGTSSYCGSVTVAADGAMTIKPGVGGAASTVFKAGEVTSIGSC